MNEHYPFVDDLPIYPLKPQDDHNDNDHSENQEETTFCFENYWNRLESLWWLYL